MSYREINIERTLLQHYREKDTRRDAFRGMSDEERLLKYEELVLKDQTESGTWKSIECVADDLIIACEIAEQTNQKERAKEIAEKVILKYDKEPERKAILYESLGELEKAIQFYEESGEFEDAAILCEDIGDFRRAKENYKKKIGRWEEVEWWSKAAIVYRRLFDEEKANELFIKQAKKREEEGNKLMACDSPHFFNKDVWARYFIDAGNCYRSAGDLESALRCYKKGSHISDLYETELQIAKERKDDEEIIRVYTHYEEFFQLAKFFEDKGEIDKALRVCEEQIRKAKPIHHWLHNDLISYPGGEWEYKQWIKTKKRLRSLIKASSPQLSS